MMRRFCIFIATMVIFATPATYSMAKITVPGRTNSWVNDYAGIIDEETKKYLENLISSIEQKTPDPIEVIVAVFPSIEGWRFDEFVSAYGEKWREIKIGKRDNGVILLVVLEEQRIGIGPGQNLRGIFTEWVINSIMRDIIEPEFSKGKYSEGIKKGTEAIVNILNEAEIPAGYSIVVVRIILLTALIIAAFLVIRRRLLSTPSRR